MNWSFVRWLWQWYVYVPRWLRHLYHCIHICHPLQLHCTRVYTKWFVSTTPPPAQKRKVWITKVRWIYVDIDPPRYTWPSLDFLYFRGEIVFWFLVPIDVIIRQGVISCDKRFLVGFPVPQGPLVPFVSQMPELTHVLRHSCWVTTHTSFPERYLKMSSGPWTLCTNRFLPTGQASRAITQWW